MNVAHSNNECALNEGWPNAGQACINPHLCACRAKCLYSKWKQTNPPQKPEDPIIKPPKRSRKTGNPSQVPWLYGTPVNKGWWWPGEASCPRLRSGRRTPGGSSIPWAEQALACASAVTVGRRSFPQPRRPRTGGSPPQTSGRTEVGFRL